MREGKAYILIIYLDNDLTIKIGSLGEVFFREGYYVYVGSGGTNVYKRISRHFRREKRVRWHIDYLTSYIPPKLAYIISADEKDVASVLYEYYPYVKGFGSSDSIFPSHLFYLKDEKEIVNLKKHLIESGYQILDEYRL